MPFGVELLLMSGLWQDTRLEMLLGDCQKEFQGGNLSTEKLGMLSLFCRYRANCFLYGYILSRPEGSKRHQVTFL